MLTKHAQIQAIADVLAGLDSTLSEDVRVGYIDPPMA